MDFIDVKLIVVAVTYPLWFPLVKIVVTAVNPYPRILAPRGTPDDVLLEPLESEEWADMRLRRQYEERGEEPPVGRLRPRPRQMRRVEIPRLRRSA